MQARLFTVMTEFKGETLAPLFKKALEVLSPMLNRMNTLSLDAWVQTAGISASVLGSAEILKRMLSNTNDYKWMQNITEERKSSLEIFKKANEAFRCAAFGSALELTTQAIQEFNRTPLKQASLQETQSDAQLVSEMYLFAALIHYQQKNEDACIAALEQALAKHPHSILSLNLLGSIYAKNEATRQQAMECFQESLRLSPMQCFANYHVGKIEGNRARADSAMTALLKVLEEVTEKPSTEKSSLEYTTFPLMVLTMIVDWLNDRVEVMTDANQLLQMTNLGAALSTQPDIALNGVVIPLLEARIKALTKIAKLKASSIAFGPSDQPWLDAYSLKSDTDESMMICPVALVNRDFYRLIDSKSLSSLKEETYQDKVASLVYEFVMRGLLPESAKAPLADVYQEIKQAKHKVGHQKIELLNSIRKACASPAVIAYFVDGLINPLNFQQLLRGFIVENGMISGLHLLCDLMEVNLAVYCKREEGLYFQKTYGYTTVDAAINPKSGDAETISVVYDPESQSMDFLSEIDTPSRLYSRIALSLCQRLLATDPDNALATALLTKKGVVMPAREVQAPTLALPSSHLALFKHHSRGVLRELGEVLGTGIAVACFASLANLISNA